MPTYTVRGRITEDGKLDVTLPPDIPCGEAEVTIACTGQPEPPGRAGNAHRLRQVLRELEAEGWRGTGRTRAQIDEDIKEQRDSWDQ